jgi:hypothetical protein
MDEPNTNSRYLMKIVKLHDQRAVVEEEVKREQLVPIALNGFSSSW